MKKIHEISTNRPMSVFIMVLIITLLPLAVIHAHEIGDTIGKIKVNTHDSKNIKNGINYIDINGDGKKDIIMSGYRDDISAHSFSVYSFYIYKKLDRKENPYEWQIVSIDSHGEHGGNEISKYVITTHQGADCVLKDARLARFNGDSSYYLVIADRPIGESYVDSLKVKFTFYKLVFDETENRFIYEKAKEINSIKKYCDVEEAFSKELSY
jgi:hypothetical protein